MFRNSNGIYIYKLFSKKLSEKQRVSVLVLFLAVFLFVKGCRSVICFGFEKWFVDTLVGTCEFWGGST